MNFKKSPYFIPALLSLLLCGVMCVVGLSIRPLFPVDETRYLTVAWEMHQSGNFVLPTLNGEAYHHKPPVLFWLINLMWSLFGVSQQAAMVVPYLAAFSVLMLTARLAHRLFPDVKDAPLLSVVMLGGAVPFVVYSNLIMFDLLLTVAVMIGVTAIWDFFKTGKPVHILLLALSIGLGALIKGPVILLHLAPVTLFMSFWMDKDLRPKAGKWVPAFLAALLAGVVIGLCWAIPAAIEGGKEFAEKIFYGQTTGRMVNAFDHKRPFFWYFMFIPLFLMPWLFIPAFWGTAKKIICEKSSVTRFLLIWALPVFAAFCLISGKQVHYLIPLMPPIALLMVSVLLRAPQTLGKRDISVIIGLTAVLMMAPHIVHLVTEFFEHSKPKAAYLDEVLDNTNITILAVLTVMMGGGVILCKRQTRRIVFVLFASMILMITGFELSIRHSLYPHYDLTPVAEFIKPLEDRPMAFAGNYSGEFGFMARRSHPVAEVKRETFAGWLKQNPTGVVIVFDKVRNQPKYDGYRILFTMPFRMTSNYMVLELKDQPTAVAGNSAPLPRDAIK